MNDKNRSTRYTDKITWPLAACFALGIVLLLCGVFLHPKEWSAVLMQIFVNLGTGMVVSVIIAYLIT
jgi:Na+/H+-dicarboxylate symporter